MVVDKFRYSLIRVIISRNNWASGVSLFVDFWVGVEL